MKRITKVVMNELAKDFTDYIEYEFKDIRYMTYNPFGDFFTFQKIGNEQFIESYNTDDIHLREIVFELKYMMKNIKEEYPQISKLDMCFFAKGECDLPNNTFRINISVNGYNHYRTVEF